jgi:predicted phosphoribosyltransferase
MFRDREDAGRQLAEKLEAYRGRDAVVIALPRGGVVTGRAVADALGLRLGIACVRKVPHPYSPEYAIGAIEENGALVLNEKEILAIDPEVLDEEIKQAIAEAKRRGALYRRRHKPFDLSGKTAIIVDDGIATGLTMLAAIRSVQARRAAGVVVAVPVASKDAVQDIRWAGVADVIVLENPDRFRGSVGAHYREFEQVEDAEVITLLSR